MSSTYPYLQRDPTATHHEEQGLRASLDQDEQAAHDHYAAALSCIPADGSADVAAQRGSITRNDGFAYTRGAIAATSGEKFSLARARLAEAVAETALFASGLSVANYKQLGPHETFKKPRRELLSEHAASLGLLARTATAEEVMIGPTDTTRQARQHYGLAHDFARLGTNGYFRVSNAMNAARDERKAGAARLPHAAVWVARAAFGTVWSIKNDRSNLKPAARTFIKRLPDIVSVTAAEQSVATRP